jgi:hypothetical protein
MTRFHLGSESEFVSIEWATKAMREGWTEGAIEISVNGFQGRISAYFEVDDFVQFHDELRALYRDLKGRARLTPRERQFLLTIAVNDIGHISVSGEAWSRATHENKLEFEFDLDQTFLAAPIDELGQFLAEHRGSGS